MKLVWKFVLVFVLLSAKYNEAPAQQVYAWDIWTQDSVGINPAYPMTAEYVMPPIYKQWLHEIEACAKISMPDELLDSIHFVEVNAPAFKIMDNSPLTRPAISVSVVNYGVVFISIEHMYNSRSVKHELLHFVVYFTFGNKFMGKLQHPPQYFDKCGVFSAEERAASER